MSHAYDSCTFDKQPVKLLDLCGDRSPKGGSKERVVKQILNKNNMPVFLSCNPKHQIQCWSDFFLVSKRFHLQILTTLKD